MKGATDLQPPPSQRLLPITGSDLESSPPISQLEFDREIVARMSARDESGLSDLILHHGHYLRNLIGQLLAWSSDVDDLYQEVLWRAWQNASSFRGNASIRTWLGSIAIHACRNHQRSVSRFAKHIQNFFSLRFREVNEPKKFQEDPRLQQLQDAMGSLSQSDREVIVLVHVQHLSQEEAAVHLHVSLATFRVRYHRAQKRLQKILGTDS